jgi:hypothetical protein
MSELSTIATCEPEWAAFAAIDWADQKNFWRLAPAGSQQQESGELENTPEAVEAWAASLQQRFGGRPVAVCSEQPAGPCIYAHQVSASGTVPVTPHYSGRLPGNLLSFRSQ